MSTAIRAYLRVRFGTYDMLDDCVQESLLALHKARHTYDPRRPLRPWLFAIVRHRTIDMLRSADPVRAGDGSEEAGPEPDLGLEIDAARLLDKLSQTLRESVLLTKMLGKRDLCFVEAYLYSVPPLLWALWLQRRRYALQPRRAALYAALAAGMIPALAMQITCMYEPIHILLYHVAPIVVLAAATGAGMWWTLHTRG